MFKSDGSVMFEGVNNVGQSNVKILKKNNMNIKGVEYNASFSEKAFWSLIVSLKEGEKHNFRGDFRIENKDSLITSKHLEVRIIAIVKQLHEKS